MSKLNNKVAVVTGGSHTTKSSASAMTGGDFDLVAIGRSFIANPDLIAKIRRGDRITAYDESMLASLN